MVDLQISEIQIIFLKPRNALVAFASCVINTLSHSGNTAVYKSFTRMGNYRLVFLMDALAKSKKINIFNPLKKESGRVLSEAIVGKFKELLSMEER